MKDLIRRTAILAVVLAGLAGALAAQAGKKAAPNPPDEKARMEAWQKAMTPGEGHKKLEPMVGTFDTRVRTWMDPSKPPEDTAGTSVSTWVLGDRYVQVKYEGIFLGETFSGIGYTGYDNVSKKYQSIWMDGAGTGMMWSTGAFDAAGKVMTMKGTVNDPLTGTPSPVEERITITDNDHHALEMSSKDSNGKMFKMMEIQYTRKK